MKKNISINISGIIFHIEEDAYERLRDYLDGINRYFANFDGSQEIIADIESRIAELFLARLNEEKQIITIEDVDSLMTTMGSIRDFQAVEEEDIPHESNGTAYESNQTTSETGSKKMYRDEKRKLLGGVCAGMAHYFNIDPLWIRLIAIILFLGSYGVLIIAYIILWIVLPAHDELSEDKKLKKMYRDPENKVIAGVSSGVAAYFAVDVVVIRLLFVIFTFVGGTGLLAYIILWIILPEAKTITDRVQMQGDPVTLTNIESSIKKSLHVKDGDENLLVKILLFPFRLIAAILSGLGKALGPIMLFLVDFLRIVAGVVFVAIGVALVFSLVIALGVFLGLFTSNFWFSNPPFIMLDVVSDSFPMITAVAGFLLIVIPSVFLILLGVSVIARKIVFNATAGWSLFAIFILSIIVLSVNVPRMIYNFSEDGEHTITQTYDLQNKTAILRLRETGMEEYDVTHLELRGHEGPDYELVQTFEAQGRSRMNAIKNAQMVTYHVSFNDSIFTFDSNIQFKDDAVFRAQRLDMTLYIPYDRPFIMDEDLKYILRNTIYQNGYHISDLEGNVWQFTKEGQLECITCPVKTEEDYSEGVENGDFDRVYNLERFDSFETENAFTINVVKDQSYKVGIDGKRDDLNDLEVFVEGGGLFIGYGSRPPSRDFTRDNIEITIYTPQLSTVEIAGASRFYMNNFNQRNLDISLTGASFAKLSEVYIDDLEIKLTGASQLEMQGKGANLQAQITGASHLDAYDYKAANVIVEAHGASSARVYATNELRLEETFASDIEYRGDARVRTERD